jgi:multidrug resistance efflux pump
MDIIMMLTYLAFVTVLFKVFRLPVTKWTVTSAGFGGTILMGWIYISMAYFHPYSPYGKGYFITTPLAIEVRGTVTEVYVDDNRPLQEGEPIFRIDPRPFESRVKSLQADLELAEKRLREQEELYRQHSGTLFEFEARDAKVKQLKADLIKADFDLQNTVVTAPEDGHLIQNRLTVGTMAGPLKVASLATFVPKRDTFYIAGFRSNGVSNIEVGARAEIYFVAKPGKVFKARVSKVWSNIEEGQILPTAHMISVSTIAPPGRIPIQFELMDDISAYGIPDGSSFGATVYSTHLEFLGELRSIFFHMFSWQNIINFEAL